MKHLTLLLAFVPLLACPAADRGGSGGGGGGDDDDAAGEGARVTMETTLGTVLISVLEEESPVTADNFLQYVDDGFYDGSDGDGTTVFHRVIPGFMAQSGGLLETGARKTTRAPIQNESGVSGLLNTRGTLAMARTGDPHSATSQSVIRD